MKNLSFRLRIALMTAFLIAAVCVALNFLLYQSGARYFDMLGEYVLDYSGASDLLADKVNSSDYTVIVDMTNEDFEAFYEKFADELLETKHGFGLNGWIITAFVTVFGSTAAYFISGISLKPIQVFAEQAESVQAKNLTEVKLDEDTIPEFRELSKSINRMLVRLSDAFETQRQFAGNAAHELRTPLALMQARLDLYKNEPPEEIEETIAIISEQIERLASMVKTLLAMSEMESVPRSEYVELAPMIDEILTDLSPVADERGVLLSQSGEDVALTGSDVLLYRLFFNLVENGIKYNYSGGRVDIFIGREGSDAVVRICDTGSGIPEKYRKSIFQPFFRVDKSRSRKLGGVGLGLALVSEVARLHGGSVDVEDSSPNGTTFVVRLPALSIVI